MKPEIQKRVTRTLILSVLALIVGGAVGFYQVSIQNARVIQKDGQGASGSADIAGLELGGPFTLTDHNGNEVTEKDYAGKYKLVYFGFTYCPAVCPTELQKMSRIVKAFEKNHPDAAQNIEQLFITVDPERDNVQVMKDYVSLFHPRLIGLTGTRPQIDFITQSYRIFATRVEDESLSDYTMDHSTFVYLMGPDDELVSIYRMKDTPDYIYKDMQQKLGLS